MGVDAKSVFGRKSSNYDATRIEYPSEFVSQVLSDFVEGHSKPVVVDLGAGTGKLGKQFLDKGCKVYFVEPDAKMCAHLKLQYGDNPDAAVFQGSGEHMNLPADVKADLIVMGDAAHWMQPDQAAGEFKRVLKPEGKVASFIRIWGQESPVTKELHHLLSEYCEDYQNSPAQFIRDMDMYSRRRGLHMISDTENETRGYTFQRELSKEDLLKYLSSTSFGSGMMEENPDGVRAKIVEPLWQFAHKEGFVTKNDKLKVAYEVQMTAGPRRITRDERIQREAETPAFVLR